MNIEYDNITEADLLFRKCISKKHRSRIRKLTARSASLLWSFYCYPGRFDFQAYKGDAVDFTLIATKPIDGLDEETAMKQVATWISSLIDVAETETVYFLQSEGSINGFEVPWEVFIATWHWLLDFPLEAHAVIPSKNIVIEFDSIEFSVHRHSISDVTLPDKPDNN